MAYYSGQGNVYVAQRDSITGNPGEFTRIGNVPNLEISIETTKFEHKESTSGSRAIDLTIVQEKKGTFTMTLEDMDLDNLALGFWGVKANLPAATLVEFEISSAITVTVAGSTGEVVYPVINHTTGTAYADITTATYVISDDSVPTTTYEFGDSDSDAVNSLNGWVDLATGDIHIYDTDKQTARGAAVNMATAGALYVKFDHGSIDNMAAFTQTSQQRWIRFSGLNTIDNEPVVIDMFKADLDPLTGYGLINEELSTFDISGSLLFDSLQAGTSKLFRQVIKKV
ncbi:MAG: hypothetical protein BMS9Abin11_1016 [Gammaproteobacteria bacterium]|nr:MAG: hypothetical protein BMS9Abin11_1016 [Gammaproteobacteria bacterium]